MKLNLSQAFAAASLPILVACTPPPTVPQDNGGDYRRLTANETALAQTIFGNQVNYQAVHLYKQSPRGTRSRVSGNGVYMSQSRYSNDYGLISNLRDQSVFIHELTHIWQKQSGQDLVGRIIGAFFKHGGDYEKSYAYQCSDIARFPSLSLEQQASVVQDYFLLENRTGQEDIGNPDCQDLSMFKAALPHYFPAIKP